MAKFLVPLPEKEKDYRCRFIRLPDRYMGGANNKALACAALCLIRMRSGADPSKGRRFKETTVPKLQTTELP